MLKTSNFQDFKRDLIAAGGMKAFIREQSIYPIAWYRLGRYIMQIESKLLKRVILVPYYFIFRFIELIFGISLPPSAKIGGGLRIWHFGQIFINGQSVIGRDLTIRQNVTIGSKNKEGKAPVIGDNVEIGAGSILIGDIVVGNNSTIGAMSLINRSVPNNSIAYGTPMKVKKKEVQLE